MRPVCSSSFFSFFNVPVKEINVPLCTDVTLLDRTPIHVTRHRNAAYVRVRDVRGETSLEQKYGQRVSTLRTILFRIERDRVRRC